MSGEELAREIRHEHEMLAALMQRLHEDMTALRSSWASARDDLRAFLNHLRRHFALEEEGGFMEDVVQRWPHAAPHVETLRAEHTQLLQEAERLMETGDRVIEGQLMRAWADECRRLLSAIREHDRKENHLIQEVFCLDVGGGD